MGEPRKVGVVSFFGASEEFPAAVALFSQWINTATSQTLTATQTNGSYRGAAFFVNIGTPAANQGVTFIVQVRDELTNTFTTVFAPTTITAAGSFRYIVHPNMPVTATAAPTFLGREWRATLQQNTTTALTISVGLGYIR